ncbi:Sec-independent protein translocase component [Helicobacter mustelae]|uniref:twin-arginine translocase TatA/TatE family subunit n=1 Tax=Helicobacter mustelae TaxID=217 RepID=UPI000E03CFDB|nr:twin-arginine translocase TatA/TatE family subunit [Helicobacter mustelae]STP12132.1 Sec-independent protein translocase component [Helicobacter mustelae]
MGGFGSIWHWVIVLLVIVLLFGAKRIPELAKGLGSGIKNFKKAVKDDEEEPIQEEEEEKPKPKKVESSKKKSSVDKQETSQKPQ